MAPLIILLASYVTMLLANRTFLKDRLSKSLMGRAAMAIMLIATGIAHFTNTEAMAAMLPDFLPYKSLLVYVTGILEFAAAIGLLFNNSFRITSILLIVFFVCVLPANIIGSIKEVALGGMEKGASYLFFRIPLQLFFIWWVYYHGIRNKPTTVSDN